MADAQRADPDRDTAHLFGALPVRTGHYRLESGYHTDTWLDLGTLFVDPVKIAPAVTMLAGRLRRYGCDAVCGPMSWRRPARPGARRRAAHLFLLHGARRRRGHGGTVHRRIPPSAGNGARG